MSNGETLLLNNEQDNSALQLLAAVRHPVGDEILRRLTNSEKLLSWTKWAVSLLVPTIGAVIALCIKVSHIDDNSIAITKLNEKQASMVRDADNLEGRLKIIEKAKDNYDINVLPQVAVWQRTAEDWKLFVTGGGSDLAHLHEMWWMKERGISNESVYKGNFLVPPGAAALPRP